MPGDHSGQPTPGRTTRTLKERRIFKEREDGTRVVRRTIREPRANNKRRPMRQHLTQFATGSAAVMATLIAGHFVIGHSPAKAEPFDTRGTAVETVQKGDRLDTKAPQNESSVVFYNDPRLGVTIATKITRNESSNR